MQGQLIGPRGGVALLCRRIARLGRGARLLIQAPFPAPILPARPAPSMSARHNIAFAAEIFREVHLHLQGRVIGHWVEVLEEFRQQAQAIYLHHPRGLVAVLMISKRCSTGKPIIPGWARACAAAREWVHGRAHRQILAPNSRPCRDYIFVRTIKSSPFCRRQSRFSSASGFSAFHSLSCG